VVLSPLKDLGNSQHVDVRLKQLECVSQVRGWGAEGCGQFGGRFVQS